MDKECLVLRPEWLSCFNSLTEITYPWTILPTHRFASYATRFQFPYGNYISMDVCPDGYEFWLAEEPFQFPYGNYISMDTTVAAGSVDGAFTFQFPYGNYISMDEVFYSAPNGYHDDSFNSLTEITYPWTFNKVDIVPGLGNGGFNSLTEITYPWTQC